jgi:hypothetical protein
MHKAFWLENVRERDHWEHQGVDERIILEWILGKYDEKFWTICI